jgi:hypothetical protein
MIVGGFNFGATHQSLEPQRDGVTAGALRCPKLGRTVSASAAKRGVDPRRVRRYASDMPRREFPTRGPSVLQQLLRRAKELNDRAGFMAWDPERLSAHPVADPGRDYPRLTPPTPESPRLFLAYAWARDENGVDDYGFDLWMDAFAGHLFNTGYDIVFDRDPRNFDKELSAGAVLIRMNDCNFFVPVVTEQSAARLAAGGAAGWAVAEWNHARQAAEAGFLAFIGIWYSGDVLPAPLTAENTIDIRQEKSPWAPAIEEMFPAASPGGTGVPRWPAPKRPPDPAHWPKFRPYDPTGKP